MDKMTLYHIKAAFDQDGADAAYKEICRVLADNSHESSGLNKPDVNQQRELLAIAALDKIAHPIKYLQAEAEKDGCKLDGYMAIQLTKDANFYQEIADKALKAIANCG